MTRILIASPVRQEPTILKEFLWSLNRLETSGLSVEYAFVDDHDEESALLRQFADGKNSVKIFRGDGQGSYQRDDDMHYWNDLLMWKVAAYKDGLIDHAREIDVDYLFFVDSDIILHPKTLVHLVGLQKDIVSEVFWTKWLPEGIALPQVWMSDQYNLYYRRMGELLDDTEIARRESEFLEMLKRPGTYKVGRLGACTLISRRALQLEISFREIYNLGLTGEDRHFCIRAAALGLDLYADTHYPPYHIYRESDLAGLEEYKVKAFSG